MGFTNLPLARDVLSEKDLLVLKKRFKIDTLRVLSKKYLVYRTTEIDAIPSRTVYVIFYHADGSYLAHSEKEEIFSVARQFFPPEDFNESSYVYKTGSIAGDLMISYKVISKAKKKLLKLSNDQLLDIVKQRFPRFYDEAKKRNKDDLIDFVLAETAVAKYKT